MTASLNDPTLLHNIPLFKSLSDNDLLNIINAPENGIEEYGTRDTIVRESEVGDAMYIIIDGYVEVTIRSSSSDREVGIATLKPGDFFGDQSLLPWGTGRRNASVRALHSAKVFRIDKKYVLLSIKHDDEELEDSDSADITSINPKFEPDEVRDLIKDMRLFKSLNNQELATIRDWTEVVTFGPGDFVIKEYQKGEHLYIVLDGTAEVFTLDEDGKILILAELGAGEFFGEQALMPDSNGKRNAFVRANNETRLIKVPKEYFRLILSRDDKIAAELREIQKNR
ncbi:MAG: cyclic nucleotide-binding domain-containing protein [Gammaproteobacteria bacterium]